jgi:hypothetical protein
MEYCLTVFELDLPWTDQFFASAIGVYQGGVPWLRTSVKHRLMHPQRMYAPGTCRHIKGALKLSINGGDYGGAQSLCGSRVRSMPTCNSNFAEELENFFKKNTKSKNPKK